MAVQRPSRRLHRRRLFFCPLTGTEHGSQPTLTTRDRELVSVLEVRIEPGDLNPIPLTGIERELPGRGNQRLLRWFGSMDKMEEYLISRRVLIAEVSGAMGAEHTGARLDR